MKSFDINHQDKPWNKQKYFRVTGQHPWFPEGHRIVNHKGKHVNKPDNEKKNKGPEVAKGTSHLTSPQTTHDSYQRCEKCDRWCCVCAHKEATSGKVLPPAKYKEVPLSKMRADGPAPKKMPRAPTNTNMDANSDPGLDRTCYYYYYRNGMRANGLAPRKMPHTSANTNMDMNPDPGLN